MNLFGAILIQVTIRLIIYIDQLVPREMQDITFDMHMDSAISKHTVINILF
jgi:hypothetical protein